jgi:hypothetical protein
VTSEIVDVVNQDWRDPNTAWWAKAARARHHIEDVSRQVSAYDPASAYEIAPESRPDTGDDSYATDLRLKVLRKPPTELLTTIGDALHNLRSCLDSVAFELAMRHTGGTMTERQQRAVQFPLCKDRAAFDGTLSSESLRDLFGDNERAALRTAQPFALREDASAVGVTFPTSDLEEFNINELRRLSRLDNLDKHRYLPLLAWCLNIAYFTEMVPPTTLRTRRHVPFSDGDLIGHLTGMGPDPASKLLVDMELTLADDPGYAIGLIEGLSSWHGYLTGWILPRIFTVADRRYADD